MNMLVVILPLLLLLVIATVCDLRHREVPDWISAGVLLWGIVLTGLGLHSVGWLGLLWGVLVGFVLSATVFYLGGLGGADVKLIAAMGAVLGPVALLFVLFWMALAGGVLALVAAAQGQRDFAYVPAITAGFVAYMVYPGEVWRHLFP
ncbi:prepilin peptidase [Lignipirellula cremea]|uniref:Type IV leader peptidase family protein n=1 Tax=Lignipirellula cremea TaxID=2528010 RepID=A0A518E411_9BACT|nr:A24 family peptidase [Lignipirellula cremea]QDU98836.1 Type IV leader peptidase family protein [Lignipirellula cremea]